MTERVSENFFHQIALFLKGEWGEGHIKKLRISSFIRVQNAQEFVRLMFLIGLNKNYTCYTLKKFS